MRRALIMFACLSTACAGMFPSDYKSKRAAEREQRDGLAERQAAYQRQRAEEDAAEEAAERRASVSTTQMHQVALRDDKQAAAERRAAWLVSDEGFTHRACEQQQIIDDATQILAREKRLAAESGYENPVLLRRETRRKQDAEDELAAIRDEFKAKNAKALSLIGVDCEKVIAENVDR